MPRTKHIVVISVLLIAILILVGLSFTFRNANIAFNGGEHTALLIQSEIIAPTAEVQKDTTREDTRSSLRAALSGYVAPEAIDEVSPEETEETKIEAPEVVENVEISAADSPRTTLLCSDSVDSVVSLDTWGLVNTTLAECARIVSSLELDTAGVPKYHLQIPMTPTALPSPKCLKPNGMVGVALDGRVIRADTPFNTNAEGIAGYALDGFGIFGMYENENLIASADLDQCHGHTHTILWNGESMSLYHYHVTEDSPYALGCFRGNPVSL